MRNLATALLLTLVAIAGACSRATEPQLAPTPEPTPEAAREQPAGAPAVVYEISEGSAVSFVGSKVTGLSAGGFHTIEGEIAVIEGDPTRSSVRVAIDTTSLWADSPELSEHLKSDDFLAVSSYPWASFTSTGVEATQDGHFVLTGNLDLHGMVREISFPAQIAIGPDEVAATATVSLDRFEFGVDFPGIADDLIVPEVKVDLTVRAIRRPTPESPEG